ncbi:MAG TPA: carboxymuconolactone decarboxylase family protein [Anaerolineae bacterium]|nr:carboxymuconolactone decarboxylase family protein [Anaerolineae bacterium]
MALDPKTRELVNVGVAVAINCQSCLDFHVKKARELQVTNEELADAVRAARDMRLTVATRLLEHAGKVLQEEILISSGLQTAEAVRTCC